MRESTVVGRFAIAGVATAVAFSGACESDVTIEPTDTTTATTTATGGAVGGGNGSGGAGGAEATVTAEILVELDPAQNEIVGGLAVRGNLAYVGFVTSGEIVTVDLTTSEVKPFASIEEFSPVWLVGLAIDPAGNVYSGGTSCVAPSVYRWPVTGGSQDTPFVQGFGSDFETPRLASDLAFRDGILFVSNGAGFIDTIDANGTAARWVTDPALEGDASNCESAPTEIDIGANGIAFGRDDAFVINSNRGTVVRIPMGSDGGAGTPEILAGPDCRLLGGATGVALDGTTLYVTVGVSNAVLAVDITTGEVTTLFAGAPLVSPNAIAVTADGDLIVAGASYEIKVDPTGGCGLCPCGYATANASTLVRLTLPH